jgi:hypothetical protein
MNLRLAYEIGLTLTPYIREYLIQSASDTSQNPIGKNNRHADGKREKLVTNMENNANICTPSSNSTN